MKDRSLKLIKWLLPLVFIFIAVFQFGLTLVSKVILIIAVILILMKTMKRHHWKSMEINAVRSLLIMSLMVTSVISLYGSSYIVIFLMGFLDIEIAIVKWFSLFNKDRDTVSASAISVYIVAIFYPAYYLYNFLLIVITSLSERWLIKYKVYKRTIECYDEKIILAYFTIISVFLGFLPLFGGEAIGDKNAKDIINNLSLAILMMSLLPIANLLFTQAKK